MSAKFKHLVSVADLTPKDIDSILKKAQTIKASKVLAGKAVALAFFEPSTRTRLSFEMAATRLGARVLFLSPGGSSLSKGETLLDTLRNITAMGPDALVIRASEAGLPELFAKQSPCPVINAGGGAHEHPTQGLLDLFTIVQKKGTVKGLQIGIIGDIAHSRVARSNMILLKKMGAKVHVVGPATMIPKGIEQYGVQVHTRLDKILPQLDCVMALRIQKERQEGGLIPSLREYTQLYGLTPARLRMAKSDLIVMHPGPVNRGVEMAPEVADGPQSVILDQVANGVKIRMAVLQWLIG